MRPILHLPPRGNPLERVQRLVNSVFQLRCNMLCFVLSASFQLMPIPLDELMGQIHRSRQTAECDQNGHGAKQPVPDDIPSFSDHITANCTSYISNSTQEFSTNHLTFA
jgi:hypothetical protein